MPKLDKLINLEQLQIVSKNKQKQIDDLKEKKVNKEEGKSLSSNDFTDSYKTQVEANTANRHTHSNKELLDTYTQTEANIADAVSKKHSHSNKSVLDATTASYTTEEKTKLSGIESGAEVNVQSDWEESDSSKDNYIKNKPYIPTKTSDLQNDSGFIDNTYHDSTKQDVIDSSHKLSSDLVDDDNATNKFVSQEEKTQITTNKNDIASLQENRVTSLSSSSTDEEYPSAKCVYDELSSIKSTLNDTIDSLDIQKIVASGNASNFFNIGDKLYFDFDNYTDARTYTKYNVDYNVLGFEDNAIVAESDKNSLDYEDEPREYTSPSMVLEWNNLIPNTLQFSVPQAWLTFKDGLPIGTYSMYITGIRSDWSNAYPVFNNKYITFTLTTAIPSGGQIRGGGTNAASWTLSSYTAYDGTQIESLTITVESTASGTLLGENWATGSGVVESITVSGNTYRIGRINHHQKVGYGSNRYKYSLYRRWLNSDKGYGQWYEKCEDDEYEVAPSTAQQNMAGFLYGLDPSLKELLKPTRLKIVVSDFDKSLADTTENGQGVDVMYDKIFVLTAVQMNRAGTNTSVERSIEGNPYQYYVDLAASAGVSTFANWTTYSVLKKYLVSNTSSSGDYFHSSPGRVSASNVWSVYTSGGTGNGSANYALRVAPACKICK